jgi:ubiquinone/menaquinone biosynthesis C-methylase UbiE
VSGTSQNARRTDYIHGHHASVLASHGARTADNSCGYLLPHLRPGQSLLDVGCGPGSITLDLAALVAPGRVVAVENVDAPLQAAREAAFRRDDRRTSFERADVMALPYPDDSFDVVHAHQVLQHLTDPVAALREMRRVCRPDGVVAFRDVDFESMTWWPASDALQHWRDTYRRLSRENGAEPDAGRRLRQWAREAGLQDVRLSTSTWTYATEEQARWWGDSQAERVLSSTFATQARADGTSQAELEQIADAWRTWGRSEDAYFHMVHAEVLASGA